MESFSIIIVGKEVPTFAEPIVLSPKAFSSFMNW